MKKLLFLLLFIPLLAFTQVPQGVGYQGVATDANGIELVNQSISIRASIISASPTGTIEWQETHNTSTDTFGLFTLTIGQGTSTGTGVQTSFADITWGANTHFLKIEMDVNGGTNYSHMGTNQMMSVPYALYAENANIDYDSIATLLSNDSSFINNFSFGGNMVFGDHEELNLNSYYLGSNAYKSDTVRVDEDGFLIVKAFLFNSGSAGQINISVYYDSLLSPPNYVEHIWNGTGANTMTVPIKKGCYFIIETNNMNYTNPRWWPIVNGSGSSSSIVDSSYIDSLVQFYSSGDGTGCNYSFPDGLFGENITHDLYNNSYTVPVGKNLYLNLFSASNNSWTYIDGVAINLGNANYSNSRGTGLFYLSEGQTISSSVSAANYNTFNGYLADENYFADCGGGGNNSGLDSTTIVNMINNAFTNNSGCQIGDDIDGHLNSGAQESGWCVDLNETGDILVIGAPRTTDTIGGNVVGSVNVYKNISGSWVQIGQEIFGTEQYSYSFGESVSINAAGNIIAVGSHNSDMYFNGAGLVRLFEYDGFSWSQIGQDLFGQQGDGMGIVSLNNLGDIVVIGSRGGHKISAYQYTSSTWNQMGSEIIDSNPNSNFGISVSISNDGYTISGGAPGSGYASVYFWDGSNWIQKGQNIIGAGLAGQSISLNSVGDIIAIGSPGNNNVEVFIWNGTIWNQLGNTINEPNNSLTGYSVSLSSNGNTLAIGSPENSPSPHLQDIGNVSIYKWDGMIWSKYGQDIMGEWPYDKSGWSISLNASGTIVAIGAPENQSNSFHPGHVRVYDISSPCNNNSSFNYDSLVSTLSNDSTFITTVSGGIGGGCDFKYPEGLDGDGIIWDFAASGSYTVPLGKSLYITNVHSIEYSGVKLKIDGITVRAGNTNNSTTFWSSSEYSNLLTSPILVRSGQIIIIENAGGVISGAFSGILVDSKNINIITHCVCPLQCNSIYGSSYTVPNGKKLYIVSVYMDNQFGDLSVDGVVIKSGLSNNDAANSIHQPIVVNSGSVVSSTSNSSQAAFNGYLADENYFADCGGGGGSSIGSNSSSSLNDSVYFGSVSLIQGPSYPISSDTITIPYIEGRDIFITSSNLIDCCGGNAALRIVDDNGVDISAKVNGSKTFAQISGIPISSISGISTSSNNNMIQAIIRPYNIDSSYLKIFFDDNGGLLNGPASGSISFQY